ncbi:hypothetical protein [Butyrivibrio sp. AE2032]|uniref:hypothetical protein n=1 Tax=Butyrivibrio sp. AE2032 TaxID=1458463 RepID=UPI000552BE66|nr:hypothetical protein [Butyrivibrio sp. AE2032]
MAKTSKSGKSSRKAVSGSMMAIIIAIVLIIACFFTYISGILPKTLTGVSITETRDNGTTGTVKNFSLLETNFHFQEVYNSYANYGMVSSEHLDEVYNEETGETYRDWLLKEAAKEMKTLALVERAAKNNGFMQYSKAREYAAWDVDTLDLYSQMYGYQTSQQYLSAIYGTGMTKRSYVDFSSREVLVQEYGFYLKQFDTTIVPTAEQIQARFDEDPSQYAIATFNYFTITAGTDADGNETSLSDAIAAAKKIAESTKDSASFREAALAYLQGKGASATSFDDGADPTLYENYSYSQASYLNTDVKNFVYNEAKAGDVKVIETDTGAYVVYVAECKVDDSKTVAYRTLTLNNETASKTDATAEEIAQAAQALAAEAATYCTQGLDPFTFYNVVKEHTSDRNELLTGGYNAGVTEDYFVATDENGFNNTQVECGQWLFEDGRKTGDVKIAISEDQKTVYVYYFEGSCTAWENSVKNNIISENFNTWNTSLESGNPLYVVNAGLMKYLVY